MATETSSLNTPKSVRFQDPSKSNSNSLSVSKVRVTVRVRPFLPHEIQSKNGNPISCATLLDQEHHFGNEVTVHLKDQYSSRNECYKLDSFFGQDDNNVREIYTREVSPMIPGIFEGQNATVFAYGATGSGKTYTMQGTDEMPGLMSLAMSMVLDLCQRTGCRTQISYYEVYMDRCYDLLEPKASEIAVLDDQDGQIHLKGLCGVPVTSMSEFHEQLTCGIQRRKVAHTGLNDVSSRSHGVLVISILSPASEAPSYVVVGKLNLIDLAGNEDNRRTLNEGVRLQESAKINLSLFALSNVIYALNNNMPRVPYRESKLTRILQDSLGGNSKALMVACLNPEEYQESVYTVSLAARSRYISNSVSSAKKHATPQNKVGMEEQLRAWLESKGKTKSNKKPVSSCASPSFITKIPSSSITPMMKKLNLCNNKSAKPKPVIDQTCLKDTQEGALAIQQENFIDDYWIESSPINGIIKALDTPPRKALSPFNFNSETSSLEAKTPKKPFAIPCESFEFQAISTPLDKFNALSNNLKSSLVEEYIDFLNTASTDELLKIKGIGSKLAEYIVELRETSPLRSLNDLEKIGLSSKQVHNMFSRAARGIFGCSIGAGLV